MAVTAQSATESIIGWSNTELKNFNSASHPWIAYRNAQRGTAPNTVAEVETFLGTTYGNHSYAVTTELKGQDGNLGFSLEHDPCM